MIRVGIGNIFLIAVAFFLPLHAFASVIITEIMYDAPGSDERREWIEVHNPGDAPVLLSEWKLFEGGVNHKLVVYSGDLELKSGAYAVLASDAETFVEEYPDFTGVLFDTAFTSGLKNSEGETLTFRNATLSDVDSVQYDPALGAAGDGNSLQRIGDSWRSLAPTPGTLADPSKKIIPPPKKSEVQASSAFPEGASGTVSEESEARSGTQLASPALAESSRTLPYWVWFVMLATVMAVGIGAAHFIRKKFSP